MILKYLLPNTFILYGHVVSDKDLIMRERYRYPSFEALNEFVVFCRNIGHEFVSYEEFLKDDSNKKILLTFDDGYKVIYSDLHPYMKKENIPYMIFISTEPLYNPNFIAAFLRRYGEKSHNYYLSREEILELKSQGVAIGFHTRTHFKIEDNTALDDKNFLKEITIDEKDRNLFSQPLSFAYPFTAPKDYRKYDAILNKLGFRNIFNTGALTDNCDSHFFRLPMDLYNKNIKCKNCILYNLEKAACERYFALIRKGLKHSLRLFKVKRESEN